MRPMQSTLLVVERGVMRINGMLGHEHGIIAKSLSLKNESLVAAPRGVIWLVGSLSAARLPCTSAHIPKRGGLIAIVLKQ